MPIDDEVVGVRKKVEIIGNGSDTDFSIDHNLHDWNPSVVFRRATDNYAVEGIDWRPNSANNISIHFTVAPADQSIIVSVRP